MVGVDCFLVNEASAGDCVHITRGTFGRDFARKRGWRRFPVELGVETTAEEGAQWSRIRTTHFYKELTRLGVSDGLAVVGKKLRTNTESRLVRQKLRL